MYPPSPPFPDPDSLRLDRNGTATEARVELPSLRTRRERHFLPALPEPLFARLAVLPGKALAIYLVLLQRSRMEGENPVALTSACLARFGINRQDKRRALFLMENAGLVRVERRGRRNPLVRLLEDKP
jgi:DNA-binding transcriptional ArsR family regulator